MKFILSQMAVLITSLLFFPTSSSCHTKQQQSFSLTVETNDLRNNGGDVVFAIYNREDAFPDEHYKKYYRKMIAKIQNHGAEVTFNNLPAGKYAVNILHDENENGKIDKGFLLPKEGIGFSNYQSIGIGNKPNFKKASFDVQSNMKINVKVIYL